MRLESVFPWSRKHSFTQRVSLIKETHLDLACFLGQGNTLHEISLDITTRKFT